MKMKFPTVPAYRVIQAAVLVVLGYAFITSFQSGSVGALKLGYPEQFRWAIPVVCDVVAGMATAVHGRVRKDPVMRRLATWYVLIPMALSWGANSIDHASRAAQATARKGSRRSTPAKKPRSHRKTRI